MDCGLLHYRRWPCMEEIWAKGDPQCKIPKVYKEIKPLISIANHLKQEKVLKFMYLKQEKVLKFMYLKQAKVLKFM